MRKKIVYLILSASAMLLTARDVDGQNLFGADGGNNNVTEITPAGTKSIFASGLADPQEVAFDRFGNLYVSESGNGTILKFSPQGTATTFASGLNNDRDFLAFDSAGNLFVIEHMKADILKITPGGIAVTFATGLRDPYRAAFDSSGNLFVADGMSGRIEKFANNGGTLSSTFTSFASGLTDARGVAFDAVGNLYEADYEGSNVYKFSTAGARTLLLSNLDYPFDLTFDSAGNLYVSSGDSANNDAILKLTTNGTKSNFANNLSPIAIVFQPLPTLQAANVVGAIQITATIPAPYYSTILQASTNLTNWFPIFTNTPPFTFTDSTTAYPVRFYRAVVNTN